MVAIASTSRANRAHQRIPSGANRAHQRIPSRTPSIRHYILVQGEVSTPGGPRAEQYVNDGAARRGMPGGRAVLEQVSAYACSSPADGGVSGCNGAASADP